MEVYNKSTIFMETILSKTVVLPITMIGNRTEDNLRTVLSTKFEGKCIDDGYIKPNSIKVTTYSAGIAESDTGVFYVSFSCMLCKPVQGMHVECYAKSIHKGGVRAELNDNSSLDNTTPLMIFLARDHHYHNTNQLNDIKTDDKLVVEIRGVRYELNDSYIGVIAKYVRTIS
jgi:DNA-directed RNA polymerase subunit E'/Rpb7